MSDEQRIALAHLRRIIRRMEDVPVTERTALQASQLALLIEDIMGGCAFAIQERVRTTLLLAAPD